MPDCVYVPVFKDEIMKSAVFFSRNGGGGDGVIDVDELAGSVTRTEHTRVFDDFFNIDDLNALLSEVETNEIDSVVLVGESHYYYDRIRNGNYLIQCLGDRGINQNKIEAVNLKNMVARPHKGANPQLVMTKAKLLIDVALEKIKNSHPIDTVEISPRKAVAVIGVNGSSFVVAQHLLDEGYKVFLINNKEKVTLSKEEDQYLHPTLSYVIQHPRFETFNKAESTDFFGYPGDYVLKITSAGAETELSVGAVVLSMHGESSLIKSSQTVFHIDINQDGSLAARDEVTARSQTQDRGIFIIKPPQEENGDLGDRFIAADATASMVINLLNKKEIYHPVKVSEVREELCSACGACVKTCMFNAVSIDGNPPVSHIDPRRCRGCGNCVTACPAEARDLVSIPNLYLFNAIDILAAYGRGTDEHKMLLIACEGCGYRCLNSAGEAGTTWPIGVLPLMVVCGGQIDTQLVMHAFARGFDLVGLAICGEGCCHNLIGNVDLERRANLLLEILQSRGVAQERLRVIPTCSREGGECVKEINDFYSQCDSSGKITMVLS